MKCIFNYLSLFLLSSMAFAAPDVHYEGVTRHVISRTGADASLLNASGPKSVVLLKVKLSDKAIKTIQNHVAHPLLNQSNTLTSGSSTQLPSSVQLGMNDVPVLDQGDHGTCATFALMAAIDAIYGEGDYYSPLCSLNLGKSLEKLGHSVSGWEGQGLIPLLARMDEFGLVSKEDQRAHGCGGVTEYPGDEEDTSNAMSLEDFHSISTPSYFSGLSAWTTLFDVTQWAAQSTPMSRVLEETKTSLNYGNRIVVGTLLPIIDGSVGVMGAYHVKNDSWVLTPRIEQAIKLYILDSGSWGGHAMVITGYDDNAVAIDKDGRKHTGLFTLRNSWGTDVGDQGNYYMSYDYFNVLVLDLEALIKIEI